MARDIDQENSEVRTLILNTLQAEERAMESDQDSMDSRSEYDEMNATYDVNEKYNPENDDEQIRLMQDAQARILHQLSLSQKDVSRLENENDHLRQENERLMRKNRELEEKNRHLEEIMSQNMNSLPRYHKVHMNL